jgi:hypothetical protein
MSDLHFDRALRGAARRGRPEGVCPDAAALASYVDRSLSPAEHAALEAHVASCAACIEHLALLAAVDAPEAPADVSDAWSFERIFGSWRWLVPVATVVLVVAVWMRLPGSREAAQPMSQEKSAEAPRPVVLPPSAGGAAARGDSGDKPAELEQADAHATLDTVSKLEASRQKTSEGERLQSAQADAFKQKERDEEAANERKNLAVAGVRPVAAPAPPPTPPSAPQVVEEAKPDAGARTESRAAADAAAAPAAKDTKVQGMAETVAVPQAAGVAGVGGSALALRKAIVVPPFAVTGPGVRLRVVSGRFERSSDGGATWTTERTGVATRVLSGDCPTAEVCWLAGDAGQVFVRAAGGTWAERPIAEAHVGVVAIKSSSPEAATATLADGRRFSTTDGGRTWTLAQ